MKVYIGSAVGRTVEPFHMKSLVPLLRDPKYGYFPQVGDALIERARGMSATFFLRETDADVHLSLDSDIVQFTKSDMDMMCDQAEELGIVGAAYICRATARTFPASMFNDEQHIEFGHDTKPIAIRWLATGCMAVHRRVFEAMVDTGMPLLHKSDGKRAFYDFYETMHYEMGDELIKLSEDYAFCERAKELGFESFLNPAIRVGHMGPYTHRLEDMAQTPLKPQSLSLTHIGRAWRIECEGLEESPEAMGRIPKGKTAEIDKKFEKLKEKALVG